MTKILHFFDPNGEYGAFSNLAEVPCEVRGQKFPNVQKAVYSFVLGNYPMKDKLLLIRNYYDLYQNYKYSKAQKYLYDLYIGTERAYTARITTDPVTISTSQRFISYRPDHLLDQRGKFVLGQDPYKYGYNMVGHVLQKMYHPKYFEDKNYKTAVFMAYRACGLIFPRLKSGQDILQFRGWLPVQILQKLDKSFEDEQVHPSEIEKIYNQFKNDALTHQYYVQQEMLYPSSLVFFIVKREAPYINFYIHNAIQDILLYHASAYVLTKDYEVSSKFVPNIFLTQNGKLSSEKSYEFKDRLLTLYASNRLPLKPSVLESIKNLINNRVSDAFVEEAIKFMPLNVVPDFPGKDPETYTLVLTDNPYQPLSPTSECKFVMDGYTFYTVLHAIYYHLFSTMIPNDKAYSLLLINKKKKDIEIGDFLPVLTTNFDAIYEQLVVNVTVDILREALIYKFRENPLLQQLLLKTDKEGYTGFQYDDPSDPIIGYDPKLETLYKNSMNWTGRIILEIRSLLNPELKDEYYFFWERVQDDIYLHAWLKKQMMDLRLSLSWFKKITPLTMKSIRLFFAKLYHPYHVIYRHIKSGSDEFFDEPEPYFVSFFEDLEMGDDVLKYVYEHFSAMFIGALQNNEDSLKKLHTKIQEEKTTRTLTTGDGKIILEKILLLLNYFPKKYHKNTLSLILTIIQGSDTLVKVPEKTFVMFYDDYPTYIYMSTQFLPILKAIPGFTYTHIGDVGYVATYLLNHLTFSRFQFFFS